MSSDEREARRRFDAAFEAHHHDVVSYCGWRTRSASDAQDAVADVFLTAWRRRGDLPEGEAARIWLYATARRVVANQRRSYRRRTALHERLALDAVTPAGESPDGERALVREALRRLSPRDREVLLLAEWEELSAEQIARVFGCRAVTARGRLFRARRRFRVAFEELETPAPGRSGTAMRPQPRSLSEGGS